MSRHTHLYTHTFEAINPHYCTGVATGKDCVIVDDLVQTGGTLMECAKVRYLISGYNNFTVSFRPYRKQVQSQSACLSPMLCSQKALGRNSLQKNVKLNFHTFG